jgi:hypothetical protein
MVQMASEPSRLNASCFNSPDELNNYEYYPTSQPTGAVTVSVHDGILDMSINAPVWLVDVPVMLKTTFPGSGIRVKAKMDAKTNYVPPPPPERAVHLPIYSLVIASSSGYDPYLPINADRSLTFGYAPPYLYNIQMLDNEKLYKPYTQGSWDGSETGYHTFEVALNPDSMEFYIDGKLVYTHGWNLFANDQVYIGFLFYPIAGVETVQVNAFQHVDWLFIDPVGSPPGDPPDLQAVCGGPSTCDIGCTASSVIGSLADALENTVSFISGNVNTIAGVVFATGFTSMMYKNSRRIASAVTRLLGL